MTGARKISARKVADALKELNQDRRLRLMVYDASHGAGQQGWGAEAFATFSTDTAEGVLELALGRLAWMPPTTRREATAVRFLERTLPFTVVYQTFRLNPAGDGYEPDQIKLKTIQAANELDAVIVFREAIGPSGTDEFDPRIVTVAAGNLEDLRGPASGLAIPDEPDPDDLYTA
jgi:hypothetical protein